MKRVIILVLAMLFMASAIAEEVDLTSMTDEELYSLQESLQSELASRELTGSIFPAGLYVVGKDIIS